jgi:hypothetical protein
VPAQTSREQVELKSFYKLAKSKGLDVTQYNALKDKIGIWRQRLHQL